MLTCLLLQALVLLRRAHSGCPSPEEGQHWCEKELNFTGECFARTNCLCLCYDIHDDRMQMSAAYFGEVTSKLTCTIFQAPLAAGCKGCAFPGTWVVVLLGRSHCLVLCSLGAVSCSHSDLVPLFCAAAWL